EASSRDGQVTPLGIARDPFIHVDDDIADPPPDKPRGERSARCPVRHDPTAVAGEHTGPAAEGLDPEDHAVGASVSAASRNGVAGSIVKVNCHVRFPVLSFSSTIEETS